MWLENLVGSLAALLTTIAFVPQVWKVLQTHNTKAISLPMYLIFTAGVFFWLVYGVMIESWPAIVANTLTLGLAGFVILYKLRYR